MEESYIVDDAPYVTAHSNPSCQNLTSFSTVLPLALSRVGRHQQRTMENALITSFDIQYSQIVCARAIAAHTNVTAVAVQATLLHPEAADRFQAMAYQNFVQLTNIIADSENRRRR